jgi:hypothetical protein
LLIYAHALFPYSCSHSASFWRSVLKRF